MKNILSSQSIAGHLDEMRKRLLICVVSFLGLLTMLMSLPSFTDSFGARIMRILQKFILDKIKGGASISLVFLDPLEPIFTILKLTVLVSLICLAPLFLYQAYAYLRPAFTKKSGKYLVLWVLGAAAFFLLGAVFSLYFLIPSSFNILISYGLSTGASPVLSMGKFFDMFLWMFLLFALPFELPILIGALSKAGVITTESLSKSRKTFYLGFAVFAAVVTPDPTPFSMLILWTLLLLLFEAGYFLVYIFESRKTRICGR